MPQCSSIEILSKSASWVNPAEGPGEGFFIRPGLSRKWVEFIGVCYAAANGPAQPKNAPSELDIPIWTVGLDIVVALLVFGMYFL